MKQFRLGFLFGRNYSPGQNTSREFLHFQQSLSCMSVAAEVIAAQEMLVGHNVSLSADHFIPVGLR